MNYGGAYRNDPAQPACAGRGGRPPRRREPDRQQGAADSGRRRLSRWPRSGLDRRDHRQARRGVPHELVGPHGAPRSDAIPDPAQLRGIRQHRGGESLSRQRGDRRLLARAGRPVRLRPSVRSAGPRPGRPDPITNALPVDVALGKVDYVEIVGFSDHRTTAEVWYRLLNTGFRIPAGAGTDAMANFASLRGPVGMNRVFVRSGPKLDYRAWLAALKAGRTFASNGPLLSFTLDGHEVGDEIRPAGRLPSARGAREPALDRAGGEARDRGERSRRRDRAARGGRHPRRRDDHPARRRRAAGSPFAPGRRELRSRCSTSTPSRRRARST